MKIDTFLHFSKDLVRQRCDEIGQKKGSQIPESHVRAGEDEIPSGRGPLRHLWGGNLATSQQPTT